ncbi:hypothetical protein SDC9_116320 [bioreactor metagenome]|uniref:Uncharacterized protein n=1 Tax=bioreactor metagenome TaxID=1076179 RepID=A0A645BVV1_9ZZZZ
MASGTVRSNRSERSVSPFVNRYICFSVSPPPLASKTSEASIRGVSKDVKPYRAYDLRKISTMRSNCACRLGNSSINPERVRGFIRSILESPFTEMRFHPRAWDESAYSFGLNQTVKGFVLGLTMLRQSRSPRSRP